MTQIKPLAIIQQGHKAETAFFSQDVPHGAPEPEDDPDQALARFKANCRPATAFFKCQTDAPEDDPTDILGGVDAAAIKEKAAKPRVFDLGGLRGIDASTIGRKAR